MKPGNTGRNQGNAEAVILVASDITSDAALVKKQLTAEYDQVFVSTDPNLAAADFDGRPPDVLVLAFNSLDKSQRYYLGLYRQSAKVHLQPHRTIVLCNKDEVNRAYQECKQEYFDDYILFWPMTHDAPRLLMAVHHALRDLRHVQGANPSAADFAGQARQLADMGKLLDRQMAQGAQRIDAARQAVQQAEHGIGNALDGLAGAMRGGSPDETKIQNVIRLEQELKRIKENEVGKRLRGAAEAMQPVRQWAEGLKQEYAPHIESARALKDMADSVVRTVLVVDDDEFQRMFIDELLTAANYLVVTAGGGVEALNILRKMRPDLILMDIKMPELDGIETTRRLRAMRRLDLVPVVMVTGNSEGSAVRDSMKAGANSFVVKPFDRDTLLTKVAKALHQS